MTEKEATVGRWSKEFFENIHLFIQSGMSENEARKILEEFLVLSNATPKPKVMDIFTDPTKLEEVGVSNRNESSPKGFYASFS
jgi:hypothetical protein